MTLADRFWSKVRKQPGDGCWLWVGAQARNPAKGQKRYGRFMVMIDGEVKVRLAHRVAFFIEHGRWPKPCALHACDNDLCVRVGSGHIFEGTNADNTADMMRKGRGVQMARTTHCSMGHLKTGRNAKPNGNGRIVCRTCYNESRRTRRQNGVGQ